MPILNNIKNYILFILIFPLFTFSQNQARNWYFGTNNGLNFAGGTPTVTTGGALTNSLGCAAISGTNGALLFYTDGVTVYNSTHSVMANGTGLHGVNASQPAIIIKQPSSANIYYIFTVGGYSTSLGLKYSTVDMSLASGMGSVTAKNVVIDNACVDKITAGKHCNGDDVWIVSTSTATSFFAYTSALLTPTGITTVISSSLNIPAIGNWIGQMKLSPNSKKIGLVGFSYALAQQGSMYRLLADFNKNTGVISVTNTANYTATYNHASHYMLMGANGYGCEFSTNSQYFYCLEFYNSISRQDLCGINSNMVYNQESTNTIDNGAPYGKRQLQLAPNGNIYVANTGSASLGRINNPNCIGGVSTYTSMGVGTSSNCLWGLPNFPGYYFEQKPNPNFTYTSNLSCLTASFSTAPICTAAGYSISGYQWNFGDIGSGSANTSFLQNPSHIYPSVGNYTVSLIRYFQCNTNDTISQVISITQPSLSMSTSTACGIGSASVQVTNGVGPYTYLWSANSQSNAVASFSASGIYSVTVSDMGGGGCTRTSTVSISIASFSVTVSTTPTLLCNGANNATVNTNVFGGSGSYSYTWSQNSINSSSINGLGAGNYTVFVNDIINQCSISKTLSIVQNNPLGLQFQVNNNNACEGNSITIIAYPSGGAGFYSYNWLPSNTNTSQITASLSAGNYIYTINVLDAMNCGITNTVVFSILPNPTLSVGSYSACPNTTTILNVSGANTYTWFPSNVISNTISVISNSNTTYTVIGLNQFNCVATKTLQIFVFPPIIANASNNSPICVGQTANFYASISNNYFWKGPSGFMSNAANPQLLNSQMVNNGIYTLTITDANGCKDSTNINLIVNSNPPIWINSNSTVTCLGQIVTLTANGANNYLWFNGSNAVTILLTPNANTLVTVSGNSTLNSCSATASLLVTVKECNLLGIEENESNRKHLSIFPNPNHGDFTINACESLPFKLINSLGQIITDGQLISGENKLHFNYLAKGIYFVQCIINGRTEIQKLVID
jgi:hypothetical protein